MEHPYIGRICPHCHKPIMPGETVVICDSCRMPNHLDCWRQHGHCGTPVCKGKIQQVIQGAQVPQPAPQPVYQPAPQRTPRPAPQPVYQPAPQPVPQRPQQVQPPRFEPVYTSDALMLQKDAGIFTENIALIKNSVSGEVFARCQMRNVTGKTVSGVMVDILCQDAWGEEVTAVRNHSYLGMQVVSGGVFGQNSPVKMADNNTRKITLTVKKILFADGTTAEYTDSPKLFPRAVTLGEHLGNFALVEEYIRETNAGAKFVPVAENGFVRCACGNIYSEDKENCPVCGIAPAALLEALDAEKLEANRQAFLEAERERIRKAEEAARIEAERIAEEQRLAKEKADRERREKKRKRRKKAIIISIISLVTLVAAACLTFFLIIPTVKYQQAVDALANKQYNDAYNMFMDLNGFSDSVTQAQEARYQQAADAFQRKEFGTAREIFASLGNYKDSADKVNEVLYANAEHALENGSYDQAIQLFQQLGNYQDSADRVNEIRYSWANQLKNQEKYDEAHALFTALGDYQDSQELAKECLYQKAVKAMYDKKYDEAYNIFVSLGDYADSASKALNVRYRQASALLDEGKFDEAHAIFISLGDYGDSSDMAKECLYRKGQALLKEKKFDEAREIFTGLGDYSDAKNMLKEITYQEAKQLMATGNYDKAKEMFKGLGSYSDAKAMINECDYQRALSYKKSGKYKEAFEELIALGNYKDSVTQLKNLVTAWVEKALTSTSTTEANNLVKTIDLNGSQQANIYNAIVAHINKHTDHTYWFEYGAMQPSKNMYVLLKNMSSSYQDVKHLKAVFKELSNDENSYSDVFRNLYYPLDKSPLEHCWKYKFIPDMANSEAGFSFFLEGDWNNWIWDYYIRFTVKNDGSTNCSYSLPKPTKPSNMSHYDIVNKIYVWEDSAGNELKKVFRFEIVDYNTIKVYCYSNGSTYTMERVYG